MIKWTWKNRRKVNHMKINRMNNYDILIVSNSENLSFFWLSEEQCNEIYANEAITILGEAFNLTDATCEYNEVIDIKTHKAIGVMFESFNKPLNHPLINLLKNSQVIWPETNIAVCLWKKSINWEIQPGPFLPVYILESTSAKQACYFVQSGIPCDCAEDVPQLGSNV